MHERLHAALTRRTVTTLRLPAAVTVHTDPSTFTDHYHSQPRLAAGLQSKTTTAATNSMCDARVKEVKRSGSLRELARMHGGQTAYAFRWKVVKPTESV